MQVTYIFKRKKDLGLDYYYGIHYYRNAIWLLKVMIQLIGMITSKQKVNC